MRPDLLVKTGELHSHHSWQAEQGGDTRQGFHQSHHPFGVNFQVLGSLGHMYFIALTTLVISATAAGPLYQLCSVSGLPGDLRLVTCLAWGKCQQGRS
ncbi:hypothetical protein E2C01_040152 [Portunus trituberculatus]|uniref:Uncharacterized protein n=1 Tax=Portunus trituberculatus TaxID=210409 RepID=A0A5B7FIX4_PORTR|nr:hypothetical protein [Portunus trituberculatus]